LKTATLKPPDQVEREYVRLLNWYVRQIVASTRRIVMPKLPSILKQANTELTQDGYAEDLIILLATFLDEMVTSARAVEWRLPGVFALLAKTNDRSLIMAVKASTGVTLPEASMRGKSLLGVNVYGEEKWIADMQRAWVKQNVGLVTSIGTQYHGQLETIIRQGVLNGSSVKQVSDKIQKQFVVTKNRATLIAQDQVLGSFARLTQIRAESIGVKQYEWATVGDSRVRPEHVDLNGKLFSWDKPPSFGHPGTPIRCRCRAALVLPEL